MSALLLTLILAAQAREEVPPPVPFAQALTEVVELAEAKHQEEALAAAATLVERSELAEAERAAARYALGLLRARSDDPAIALSAARDFEATRALAGPGPLRLDATYNLGRVHLQEAERYRAQLPEIAGAGGQPAPGTIPGIAPGPIGASTVPGAGEDEKEDPLARARAFYIGARAFLIERLRAEWSDGNTRANLELVQRRLRELDEIERQREEQEQEQQQEEQQQDGEPSEDQEGEPNDEQEGEPSEEGSDGDSSDPSEEPGEETEPQDGEPQDEEASDPLAGEQEREQPEPGQAPAGGEEEQPQPSAGEEMQAGEGDERHLTREEVMRLLDRLAELEEQGRALEAQLRQARRTPVARDW